MNGYPAGTTSNNSSSTLLALETDQLALTTNSYSSWSLSQQGTESATNTSTAYSFNTISYNLLSSLTVSSLGTIAITQSGSSAATLLFTPTSTTITGTSSVAFGSFSSSQVTVQNQLSTSSYSVYELGSYLPVQGGMGTSNYTMSLACYNAMGSGSNSMTLTLVQTQNGLQTVIQNGNLTGYGPNAPSTPNIGTQTSVLSSTTGLTVSLTGTATSGFSQVGVYQQGSFSLSCCTSSQNESATQSSTASSLASVTVTGSYTGAFILSGGSPGCMMQSSSQMGFTGLGTQLYTSTSGDTVQDYRTLQETLSAVGSVTNGGNSLTLSGFTLQQSSSDSQAESRQTLSGLSFTGSNQSGAFAGNQSTTGNTSLSQYVSSGWSESGSYQSNQWGVSQISYNLSQQGGLTYSYALNETWSGACYNGNDSFNVHAGAQGSVAESGQGCFTLQQQGGFDLSTYALSGGALGCSNVLETGTANGVTYNQANLYTESQALSAQGSYANNSFGYSSYSAAQANLYTQSNQQGAYQSSTTVSYFQVSTTGSAHAGTQVQTSWSTYTFGSNTPQTTSSTQTLAVTLGGQLCLSDNGEQLQPLGQTVAGGGGFSSMTLWGASSACLPLTQQGGLLWESFWGSSGATGWLVSPLPATSLPSVLAGSAGQIFTGPEPWPSNWSAANGTPGLAVGHAGWGVLDPASPGPGSGAWSWQEAEAANAWNNVTLTLGDVRNRAESAQPSLDGLGLAQSLGWEVTWGDSPLVGSSGVWLIHVGADFSAGFINTVTGGLFGNLMALRSEWYAWANLASEEPVEQKALYIPMPGGGKLQVYTESAAYRWGGYAGQAVQIYMTIFAPTSGLGGAINSGMQLTQTAAAGMNAGQALANGDVGQAAVFLANIGLTAMRGSQLCQAKGAMGAAMNRAVSAAQMGLGVYGAAQGASRAWERFQAGEYFGSLLDLVQSGADLYAGWRSCFTGEMLIDWAGGKKRADAVEIGDLLWSRDENDPDGDLVLKRVLSVMVRTARIWHLRVGGQVLRTTGEHPFWVENRQAWLAVHELRVGDVLRTRDGRLLAVEGVEETGTWERVYNFLVEDFHTYFVSATEEGVSVWAHNAGESAYLSKDGKKFADGYDAIFRALSHVRMSFCGQFQGA